MSQYDQNRTPAPRRTENESPAARRERRKQYTLRALTVTFMLTVLIFVILLCISTVLAIRDRIQGDDPNGDKPPVETPDEPDEPTPPATVTITLDRSDIATGELIVVNGTHPYTFPADTSHMVNVYQSQVSAQTLNRYFMLSGDQLLLERTAYRALDQMLTDFATEEEFYNVLVSTTYRSHADQAALNSSTKPGYSEHHTGYNCALMVRKGGNNYDLFSDAKTIWLRQNCYKYGFVIRYPSDKSSITGVSNYEECLRYVGPVHAYAMSMSNWCLEEYLTALRNYPQDTPLTVQTESGTYSVFYVPAVGDVTTVSIPAEAEYTTSGDNEGGFIVTVKLS